MIIHDSRDLFYRIPFGAVENGTTVILRLKFAEEKLPEICRCNIWRKGYEAEINMLYNPSNHSFECTVDAVSDGAPIWYYFVFIYRDKKMLFYGNNKTLTGGQGTLFESNPLSYQITVFSKDFKTPSWWKEGPVYHIFVDRFYKSDSYSPPISDRVFYYHDNWSDNPLYLPHEGNAKYFPDDFFGGNLLGVLEKLNYIKSLGIRTIYLSPVFEAHSNHKYDTADYSKIDPSFGSNGIFKKLCTEAASIGIKVILDGVFSHTGDDSIYFNKYGRYSSVGAFQSQESPYFDWYTFEDYPDKYKCWWNVINMPTVNKDNPDFREFVYGENGIAELWLKTGSSGWRLDVADELPMDFLEGFRKNVKAADQEALIIGEVWEDASNKVSYGSLRNYCYGNTLDSVMNYPLRTAILEFMSGKTSSAYTVEVLMCQMENYPTEFMNAAMNLLGSHDRARLRTVFSGAPDPDTLTRAEQSDYIPDKLKQEQSADLVMCATALMFTMPGVPYIYYGDEAGLTGMSDPFNRKTYPWGNENTELLEFFRFIGNFRNGNRVLINGKTSYLSFHDDVFGCLRTFDDRNILTLINRSSSKHHIVHFNIPKTAELMNIKTHENHTPVSDGTYTITLPPLTYKILQSS